MKLPGSKHVSISRAKLLNYVLSETHATGKFKAKYFRGAGFNETNVELFDEAIRKIAQTQEVKDELPSSYGTKYIIDGKIKTPKRKFIKVRTVWIIEGEQEKPRFVTIYPV